MTSSSSPLRITGVVPPSSTPISSKKKIGTSASAVVPVVTPPSLPRRSAHTAPSNQQHTYILVIIERSSQKWGISLLRNAAGDYLLGDSIHSFACGCWMIQSRKYVSQIPDIPLFVRMLFQQTPIYHQNSSTRISAEKILKPGDVILSVGNAPMRSFAKMSDFCQFMRDSPSNQLQFVLRRDHSPTRQVQQLFATATTTTTVIRQPPPVNPLFSRGDHIVRYEDGPEDPDNRTGLFLNNAVEENFPQWLKVRKRQWRALYDTDDNDNDEESTVAHDFWTPQGFDTFQNWVISRTQRWKTNYSWNRDKRQRLKLDCSCQSPDISIAVDFPEWLRVRKNQWRIERRRKRHRNHSNHTPPSTVGVVKELQWIDEIIIAEEKQEEAQKSAVPRKPLDLMFMAKVPDDVLCNLFRNLLPVEQLRLLQINTKIRDLLIQRDNVWRLLCPKRWKLPRRPRKPYYMIYSHNLRIEQEASRKKWDDLLSKVSNCLLSGDLVGTVEKLITDAEANFQFDINYASGVVCERNAILNLAVIHRRPKVVRWLVEVKGADIETYDRGNFTPLMNAAWAGDRYLVRYLMQQGADRTKIGRFHYTKPVAPLDFPGHTPEGWATKNGHDEIARLLALGL